jgi:hypothetical protein
MDSINKIKLYSDNSILVAVFLAGPVAGGILLYKNFKSLNEPTKARICIAASIAIVALVLFLSVQIESHFQEFDQSKLTYLASHIFLFTSAFIFVKLNKYSYWTQNKQFDIKKGSAWGVTGASFVGIIITFATSMFITFFIPPFEGNYVKLEGTGDYIYYNENANQDQAIAVGSLLYESYFFVENQKQYAMLEVSDDSVNIILEIQEDYWSDTELIGEIYALIANLEYLFTTDDATVTARSYNFTGVQDKVFKLDF